jgi:C-terminal processing protease CtpA/Prc
MINGRSAQEMLANFAELFAAECRHPYRLKYANNPNLLRFLLFLEYGEVESWDLKIKLNDGKVNSYTINSVTATEITDQEEKHNDFGSKFSYHRFPDYNAVLLNIKSFGGELKQFDVFRHDFSRFLNDSFQKIRQQNISNLIIDISENEGGTESPVHMLMEYLTSEPYRLYEKAEIKISAQSSEQIGHLQQKLPDKFEGKKQGDIVVIELGLRKPPANLFRFSGTIFVLTGSRTWSAGTVFASAMKCFNVGTLVGEETPDPPTLYGSCVFSELPNSELQFIVASKLLVAACGKPDGRGVIPDHEVKQRPKDTAKGVDTVLQFTLDMIKKSNSKITSIQNERVEK